MSPKNSNISLTVLSISLAVLLLGLAGYTYNDYKQDILDKNDLAEEKAAMENELDQLVEKYENVQALNSVMDSHLIEAKKRIVNLLDTIRSNEPKLQLLMKFRREMEVLKTEKFTIFRLYDSITNENKRIKGNLNQTSLALNKSKDMRKILIDENKKLVSIVKENREISFSALKARGVKIKGSGKEIATSKIKRTDRISVCYTIRDNPYTLKETKQIYLKVFNPKKVLLGDHIKKSHEGNEIEYSSVQSFFYKNQQLDGCIYMPVKKKELLTGTYLVEIYTNHILSKTTTFILN